MRTNKTNSEGLRVDVVTRKSRATLRRVPFKECSNLDLEPGVNVLTFIDKEIRVINFSNQSRKIDIPLTYGSVWSNHQTEIVEELECSSGRTLKGNFYFMKLVNGDNVLFNFDNIEKPILEY